MSTRLLTRLAVLIALASLLSATLPSAERAAAAAPSPAACVKAKKKVSTAKARLAKSKRAKASRRALAKARKDVRRAEKARRAACRGPAPGPRPAPVAPPVAPAGEPAPPVRPDAHDHPHDEPAPQPQPGPGPGPEPDPDPPTSHALIAKALAEGRIDAETALRYEVFAEYGDGRLPAEFRGAPLRQADTDTLDRVAERWEDLSSATRDVLDPFFVPPFNAGSWYEPGAPAGEAAEVAGLGAPGSDLCDNTAPNMTRWGYVTAVEGTLRVWYENTVAGQQAKAIAVADHLDGGAYAKLKGVFRAPLPDGGDLAGQRCRGLDPAVDLALVPLNGPNGQTVRYAGADTCNGPFPGFAVIRRDLAGDDLMAAVIHEVSHLAHFAYQGDRCGRDWHWLTEATAQWMVTHADDYGPKHPESYAGNFWDRPGLPLETHEGADETPTAHQYGAYLFFQWLAMNNGADAVSEIWDGMESPVSAVDRIQTVLAERGYDGGFEQAWKEFALAGLNPRPQVDWFQEWGALGRGAAASHHSLSSGQTKTLDVEVPHLAAQYHVLTFTDGVKGIEVTNPLAGQAGASLQAWLRIDDGGTERIEVVDWTGSEKETFCRDVPGENVQEMALVVANSTHASRTHVLHDDPAVRTTTSCGAYDATAKATIERDGLTEVYTAAYSLTPLWTRPADGGGIESFFSTDNTTAAGNASWSMSGVSKTTGCTWSGQATIPVGPGHMQATLLTRDLGKDDPRSTYEFSFGIAFHVGEVTITCPDGDTDVMPWQLGHGFQAEPKPWDPTGQGIVGSQKESHPAPGAEITREWTLTRKVLA